MSTKTETFGIFAKSDSFCEFFCYVQKTRKKVINKFYIKTTVFFGSENGGFQTSPSYTEVHKNDATWKQLATAMAGEKSRGVAPHIILRERL